MKQHVGRQTLLSKVFFAAPRRLALVSQQLHGVRPPQTNTLDIIWQPRERTHGSRQIMRPMCRVILMLMKKSEVAFRPDSALWCSLQPPRRAALQFICLTRSQCVMRLLVFGEGEGGGGGAADRVLTSWVLPLETVKTSRKHTQWRGYTDKQT